MSRNSNIVTMKEYVDERIATLEKRFDRLENNHLKHLQKQIESLDIKFDEFSGSINKTLLKHTVMLILMGSALGLWQYLGGIL